MSTRALRKLQCSNLTQNVSSNEDEEDAQSPSDEGVTNVAVNRFTFLAKDENESDEPTNETSKPVKKARAKKNKNKTKHDEKAKTAEDEELDAIVQSLENSTLNVDQSQLTVHAGSAPSTLFDESSLLKIEFKNLRADNELSRMFGMAVRSLGEGKLSTLRRNVPKLKVSGGKIVQLKPGAAAFISRTGLTMKLIQKSANGVMEFRFEHNASYQTAQLLFWNAVEKMNPELFVAILREYPCHVDTLLQMSDIYRMNEDFGTARDLVERAIATCEAAFHPLFNPALINCRLFYKQQENRPLFLALLKHMQYLCQRACFRTALEFAKLIYSLDQDEDPLGILLVIDYLCLRCKQYDYLINFYYVFEAKRNLSLLPNFCYSVALAKFLLAQKSKSSNNAKIDGSIQLQEAIQKFPTMLHVLIDRCSVEPDARVSTCDAFSLQERKKDGKGLQALYQLYASRCWSLWKEADVMAWLEANVHKCLQNDFLLDKNAKFLKLKEFRQNRYVTTPLNVCRHVILSGDDVKSTIAYLPYEVQQQTTNNYDPLPPDDSVCDYNKPEAAASSRAESSIMSAFLRSLMPNYNPEADHINENNPADFQQSVQNVLRAMRDLLNDIQLAPADREDGGGADQDQEGLGDDPNDWVDDFD